MLSRLLEPCMLFRLQSWISPVQCPPAVEQILGVPLPMAPGSTVIAATDVLCVGPTDWLTIAARTNSAPVFEMLDQALEGSTFRITNVSAALVRIRIEGERSRALLSKGCSLDFHPQVFAIGRCARTHFAGMPVIVRCVEPSAFECIVGSSYRDYLISWLADAATGYV